MTAAAKRIQASAFAPILDWTKGAEVDLMHDVVEYINDAIRKAEESKRKAEDEYLARKMAEINISPRIKKLIEQTRLSPKEAEDERTRYILGLDRK